MNWLFFSKEQKQGEKIYLGLFLKQESGVCLLLQVGKDNIKILKKEKFIYSNGWENLTEDVDEVLFRMEKETKEVVKETIIFVYSYFIHEETGDIAKPYLNKIKSLAKSLDLKPIGYLECHEALVAQLEKREQLVLTAIILELDKDHVDLFVYKSGHLVVMKKIMRSDDLINDLESTFLAIKDKTLLPSRIIIYNSVDLNELSIQIVSYRWKQEIFIQTPRVEIIGEQEIFRSLADLFYNQLANSSKKTVDQFLPELKEEKEVMGFVIDQEVAPKPQVDISIRPKLNNFTFPIKEKLSLLIKKIKIPNFSMNLALIVGLFLIIVSIFLSEFFLHKAEVTVYVPTKEIGLQSVISGTDIAVHYATKSAQIEVGQKTTGKKMIGNTAQGEITIYNYDDKERVITKNTLIETVGLQFSLDEDATVPTSTFATDLSKLPGKAKIKVTAEAIGPKSNLDKGQKFKIGDLSSSLIYAINESEFSGGAEKEIKTVSKKDQDDLKLLAVEKGKKVFENDKKNTNLKEKMIPDLIEYQLGDSVFSGEVGEESTQLTLKTNIIFSYYGYQESKLFQYLQKELQKKLAPEDEVNSDKIAYKIVKAESEKNKVILNIQAKSKVFKKVKEEDILKNITGKNKKQIEMIFKEKYNFSGFKIKIVPELIFFSDRMPFSRRNIILTVSSL